jgi:branched-chain amino acid transport system substrate-binding protein
VLEATAVGAVIAQTGRQRVAVLAPDDDYGRGMAEAIQAQLEAEGATVSAVVPYRADDVDVAPVVTAALEGAPEAIAVVGLPEAGGRLLAELKAAGVVPGEGFGQVLVVVTDGLRVPNLYQRVAPGTRDATAGVWGVAPSTVPEEATSFVEAFGAFAPGVAVDYAGFAYDCTILIALASKSAGSDNPILIAAHLANVSRGGVRCDSYAMCATLLGEGRNIDYAGVTGAVDLTNGGDSDRGFYDVFEFNDDGSTTVRTRSLVRLP